ncbi:hypothetical protein [Ferrimonas sediminicola]|uniref:hypothetical protein n=1 Tax=Ferrimonas sediminicola TaxID=2569538 RepID=UPI00197A7D3A|nr:hypothetical protein [Ferrimonas sediminicola]
MNTIIPYQSLQEALTDLDNGGRFYNVFTSAHDGVVEPAELARVAGVFSDTQRMMLFLEMALSDLTEEDKARVIQRLSPELNSLYHAEAPRRYTPVQAKLQGRAGEAAILCGVPRLMESAENFAGMITVPISAGTMSTFTMIPIVDHYDVYQVRDGQTNREFVVAHARGETKLPESVSLFGGTFKELQQDQSGSLFLEVVYYVNHHTLAV